LVGKARYDEALTRDLVDDVFALLTRKPQKSSEGPPPRVVASVAGMLLEKAFQKGNLSVEQMTYQDRKTRRKLGQIGAEIAKADRREHRAKSSEISPRYAKRVYPLLLSEWRSGNFFQLDSESRFTYFTAQHLVAGRELLLELDLWEPDFLIVQWHEETKPYRQDGLW
jgi:hypothetical protein